MPSMKAVRIALEIVAILESAGLALVGVDRHQARRRLGAHQRPFAAGREAGAAEAAQAGIADDLDQLVARALAGEAVLQQRDSRRPSDRRRNRRRGCQRMRMRFAVTGSGDLVAASP